MIACDLLAYHAFAPVLILILLAIVVAVAFVGLGHLVGPKRSGPVKDDTYESGMPLVGDARRRFNVRFYTVAMMFLLFDVEVVFLWPWAPLFHDTAAGEPTSFAVGLIQAGYGKEFLLVEMVLFVGLLLIGYVYDWKKGIFEWS